MHSIIICIFEKKIHLKKFHFIYFILILSFPYALHAQKKIDYENNRFLTDEEKYPGALIFVKAEGKQPYFTHEGIDFWCDQAILYPEEDFLRAYGNVQIKQGDSIQLQGTYAEYNGKTQFAFISNRVKLETKQNTLTTDSLFFDRKKQQAFYRSGGTVKDTASTINSKIGRYYMQDGKYSFLNNVVVTHPKYIINSQHIDFYEESGHAYLYGPSTITGKDSKVYCERGFYDTRGDVGHFVKNASVDYKTRNLRGDSIYFNRERGFASATNHIKVTDTANQSLISGHYAEVYREKDSVFITKRALASMKQERDSIHIHSDTLMITGKTDKRIIRGYYNTRLFKSDMSGKCDSVHISEVTGVTKMMGKPIVWAQKNQLTGDTIKLINNPQTDKLDSLLVYYNAFMIQKDTVGDYNQVKGKEMFGLFNNENELTEVNFIKNTETIYYSRDNDLALIGINKAISSSINIEFKDKEITYITYHTNPKNTLYPEKELPENARKLKGFNWRGNEMLRRKEDLFIGKDSLELPKIKGIDAPKTQESFFEQDSTKMQLHKNSRLTPNLLKHPEKDSINTTTSPNHNIIENN